MLPENIKSGVSIFNVPGTFEGGGTGSGTFDLAKVTEYTPYSPEITATTSINIFAIDDYSEVNGHYFVTPETEKESDPMKRIYKHESAEWYIWCEGWNEDSDYPEYWWHIGIAPSSSTWEFIVDEPGGDLPEGIITVEDYEGGYSYDVTLDVTKTDYPGTPMVLKGVMATGYADGEWSFDTAEQNFTGFEYSPSVGSLYVTSGNALVGMSVDVPGGIMYLRFRIDKVRGSGNDQGVQFSEFLLFDKDGNPVFLNTLNIAEVSADEKNDSPSEQKPEKAFDGEVSNGNNKWFSWSFNNPSWVQVRFSKPVAIANYPRYGWYTANDTTARDPVSWSVMVSKNGEAWTPISVVKDYATPTERGVLAGKWEF